LAVPTKVVPAKKSTFATVAGATALALATTLTPLPAVTIALFEGVVIATDGPVTFTLTMVDVADVPFVSVARAVSAVMPVAEGVQLIV
jgi:hypothetical protein